MTKAIITLFDKDNQIIGDVEVRKNVDVTDFPQIAAEFEKKVADPKDDLDRFQLLAAPDDPE